MAAETALLQFSVSLRSPLFNELFIPVTAFGSPLAIVIAFIGLYYFERKGSAVVLAVGAAAAGVAEKSLNLLVARPRPEVAPYLIQGAGTGSSFPSGHATLAFLLATVLYREFGKPAFFFTIAALVAFSRLYIGVHYPSDVLAGALLGIVVGFLVERYREELVSAVEPFLP
ncbi:MAG: phosphatase PAP2 family protein [Candidatus Nanohaloarchaea archaeon]